LWTQQRFAKSGLSSPRLDAEVLLSHCLGKTRVGLYLSFEQPLVDQELAEYRELIKRRLAGEPVAYLVGQREFFSLPLHVTPAVLIPRPETELLVEEALRLLTIANDQPSQPEPSEVVADAEPEPTQTVAVPGVAVTVQYDPEPTEAEAAPAETEAPKSVAPPAEPVTAAVTPESQTVVDVGTGSGAIALAIKHERPSVRMIAIDRSPVALEVARGNAASLNLAIEFLEGDLLSTLPAEVAPDLLLANLPFIPTADLAGLSKDVQSEPRLALDGGADGLRLIERLVTMAARRLKPGASILLEVGAGQAPAVEKLLRQAGFVEVHSLRDLAGIERVVSGRRSAESSRRLA
jgi:release factor glutamine methyltransferase